MVIVRIWCGIVSVHSVTHMKVMKVGLNEVIGTDVMEVSHLLSGILVQTKNNGLDFIQE